MTPIENSTGRDKYLITYREVFSYRGVWMTLATAWVIWYHCGIICPGPLRLLQNAGYGGVEIFLFASGIGCFFSLHKDPCITRFLKRRLASIFPMWAIFLTIYCLYQFTISPMTLTEILGNVFGLGFFSDMRRQFNWYIGAMWLWYLMAPILYDIVCHTTLKQKCFLTLALTVFTSVFFEHYMLIVWARVPLYFLSFVIAQRSLSVPGVTRREALAAFAGMAVGAVALAVFTLRWTAQLTDYGLWWYPFILITPGMLLAVSLVCKFLSGTRLAPMVQAMNRLGRHTFAMYLGHVFVFDLFSRMYRNGILEDTPGNRLLALVLSIPFTLLLHCLTKWAVSLCKKRAAA